ncbi:hypothetical protein J6590_034523 [Homalodisca vitripennis]|nr:hypothetical protein J6590_034523 [Homalodisca vitripennis]
MGRDHFWLVYTFQLIPPLGTAKTDVSFKSVEPRSGTPLTVNVVIMGFKDNDIGLVHCGR